MQNFQDTFEKRKRTFVSAFSIRMAVPLIKLRNIYNYIQARNQKLFRSGEVLRN